MKSIKYRNKKCQHSINQPLNARQKTLRQDLSFQSLSHILILPALDQPKHLLPFRAVSGSGKTKLLHIL